ncbi:MAG: lytic transglycosylase domain-containing protein [Mangrovicoccus sp.]
MRAAARDAWPEAATLARSQGGTAPIIIEWMRLRDRDTEARFADYHDFLTQYSDWPGLPLLRRRGEQSLTASVPAKDVLSYFSAGKPQTANGALHYARALRESGKTAEAEAELARAWRELAFTEEEHKLYLSRYSSLLAPHHTARLDAVLWRGAFTEATYMRPLVDDGWAALLDARRALRQDQPGVDTLIAKVPAQRAMDAGLAYERMQWRARKGRMEAAVELMLERSDTAEKLGRPEAWADRRRRYARQYMRDKNYLQAYRIASIHQLTEGNAFADLEWLSGYIALRFLNEPGVALSHFRRFRAAVASPISLGRAGYWEGRALEALGEPDMAGIAYAFGAEFQTSFYGQLAAEKAGISMDPRLTGSEGFPDGANADFRQSTVYKAGVSLHQARDLAQSARFFAHLAESMERDQIGSMTRRLEVLDSPYIQLRIAKRAASMGMSLHRAYFPLTDFTLRNTPNVSRELALSIARRESEFNPSVISHAGARGLMQLMPGTAQLMSRETGLDYNLARLTQDAAYNARLGTAYLQRLTGDFGKNVPLIAAGYNAGPGRPIAWIERYGDPRSSQVDAVDWIEHIPFRETRNYVMRIMESLAPYRARMSGQVSDWTLSQELKAR